MCHFHLVVVCEYSILRKSHIANHRAQSVFRGPIRPAGRRTRTFIRSDLSSKRQYIALLYIKGLGKRKLLQ